MYIPFDPPHKLIPLKESVELVEDALEERLHSYSWQHAVAKEAAVKLWQYLPTISREVRKYLFDIKFKNPAIKKVEIYAQKLLTFQLSASFAGFNPDEKKAIVNVIIPEGHYKNEAEFVPSLTQALSHELNHAGTALDKYGSGIMTVVPDLYEKIQLAIQDANKYGDNETYYFCYSLYCTCNMEITAFISQVESQLREAAGKDILSTEEIKQYLPKTHSYQSFIIARNVAKKWMEITAPSNEFFKNRLKEKYGIDFPNFDDVVNDLYNRAQYGLERCCANAMNCVE